MVNLISSRSILKLCLVNPTPFPKQPSSTTTLFGILHFSTSHHPSQNTTYPSRRHEEESRGVRVSVWWDFENCGLPNGANVFKVAQSITAAIRANGIKGPVQITAFGDVLQLSRSNQEALSSTGITLTHIPHGGKNSADRSLLVDLMYWVSQNPPPAHLFLISGDRDFASILHRLRMNNYNILLASPVEKTPSVLCSAASIMWQWNDLVRGENLTGKHFNQPPDGPYGSWYGHYRAPLEDPFSLKEQPSGPRSEELSDSGPEPKPRAIPKSIMNQIRHILFSYPKGISITELRSELAKTNGHLDKDFYGYKKFSRLLLAMPQILKLQSANDGQFLVRGITQKVPEASKPVSSGELNSVSPPKLNGEKNSSTNSMDEKLSLLSVQELKDGRAPANLQESKRAHELPKPYIERSGEKLRTDSPLSLQEQSQEARELPREALETSHLLTVVDNDEAMKSQLHGQEEHSSVPKSGILRRFRKMWFGNEDSVPHEEKSTKTDQISGQKMNNDEDELKLTGHSAEQTAPSVSPTIDGTIANGKLAKSSEANSDKSRTRNIFSHLMTWFRSWRNPHDSDGLCEKSHETTNPIKLDSSSEHVFSNESFWNEIRSFLDTPQASSLVLRSRTRVQLAHNLWRDGPSVLGSLSNDDLVRMVDLLIADKKWVEEDPFLLTYPFKLKQIVAEDTSKNIAGGSNGLSSMFLNNQTQSNLLRKREPNCGFQPFNPGKLSQKSRNEIADCQSLVKSILKEHPEGFHIQNFRILFQERFGYRLEIQKLGFSKLADLLQTMPGLRIESSHIFPARNAAMLSDKLSDMSRIIEEELGPITDVDSKKEWDAGFGENAEDEMSRQVHHDFELLSDDDSSDSGDEGPSSVKTETKKRGGVEDDSSSLLEILSDWHKKKEERTNRKDKLDNIDGSSNSAKDDSSQSAASGFASKNETAMVSYGQSKRQAKSYSFVAGQPGNDRDKLIGGILSSLSKSVEKEKSSESRTQV